MRRTACATTRPDARSTTDLEWFWSAVLDDLGIEFYERPSRDRRHLAGIPWTRWCVGGRLNIVHNCLDKWIGTPSRHRAGAALGGRRRARRATLTYARAASARSTAARTRCGARRPARRSRRAVHADVSRAGRRVLRHDQDRRRSSCRCSPATAPTPCRRGCGTRRPASLFTADGFWRRGQPVRDESGRRRSRRRTAPSVRHVVVVVAAGRRRRARRRPRSAVGRSRRRAVPHACDRARPAPTIR